MSSQQKIIDTGSDFTGVGAFDFALLRAGLKQNKIFACDKDNFARDTYVRNFGEPELFPRDVYDRPIPEKPLDLYMTSPPCQAFSGNGKRAGKDDAKGRGILFYNSHEFIQVNKPRGFIFENVKGLLSHDRKDSKAMYGRTFNEWINMLGGKSVNGNPTLFPYDESLPYHIYFKVLNSKHFGVPQSRERIFIVGIRDDEDNDFEFPKGDRAAVSFQDLIDHDADEKYMLSDAEFNNILWADLSSDNADLADSAPEDYLRIKVATKKGWHPARINDIVNYSFPKSTERRGRVRRHYAGTLETKNTQAIVVNRGGGN